MVIHAGDLEPSDAKWEIPEAPPSQPSQIPLDSVARVEPFALAEDLTSTAAKDASSTLVIPPPAVLPREARFDQAPGLSARAENTAVRAANRRIWAAVATAVVLVGVIAVAMLGRGNGASVTVEPSALRAELSLPPQEPTPVQKVQALKEQALKEQALKEQALKEQALTEQPQKEQPQGAIASATAAAALDAPPSSTALEPTTATVPDTTRVTLEVQPADAKVNQRGVGVAGPPFVFDVPKGKRITVEVARAGFVTRKVVIEDKKSVISLGLVRAPQPRQQR